jgi:hypothetical protein
MALPMKRKKSETPAALQRQPGRSRSSADHDFWPEEIDPMEHPESEKEPIERERARPKDSGRGGA